MKILFVAKGSFDSGNFNTISRIRGNLEKLKSDIVTDYFNVNCDGILKRFAKMLNQFEPDTIVGLNLVRCLFLLKAHIDKSRLILILGGTDVNEPSSDQQAADIRILVNRAKIIVSFNEEMKARFLRNIMMNGVIVPVQVIAQGISAQQGDHQIPSVANEMPTALTCVPPSQLFFVVVGRLRPVKDPEFIVKPFLKWHSIPGNEKFELLYIGSIEENSDEIRDFVSIIDNLTCVRRQDSISHESLLTLMRNATALINCSKNEGQNTTILEAMQLGVPVVARRVAGNASLLKHNKTGLLFGNDKEFMEALTRVARDFSLRYLIIANARNYVIKHHGAREEAQRYLRLLIRL